MPNKNKEQRCKAKAKSGKPCRAAATAGGLCFFHANPNKASELGRIGGRSNRPSSAENTDPLPNLNNAVGLRDALARLMAEVYAGKIDPRVAAGLAPLMSLQLRTIETVDLAERLVNVERLLAKPPSSLSGSPDVPEQARP